MAFPRLRARRFASAWYRRHFGGDVQVVKRMGICLGYPGPTKLRRGCTVHTDVNRGPPCDKERQVGAVLIGKVWGESHVLRTCRCNAVNALARRHLVAPPTQRTRKIFFPRRLAERIKQYYYDDYATEYQRWLDKWPASKREAILKSVRDDPILDGRVKLMVKRENAHALPSKARGIQMYRNLATQAKSGAMHTAFQRSLKKVCADEPGGFELFPGIRISATSGWTCREYAAWAQRVAGYQGFFESDASNFDASVDPEITQARARFAGIVDRALQRDISAHIRFRGRYFGDVPFGYTGVGTVKSGHNDTTWGNTLVTLFVGAIALKDSGLTGDVIAAGDDLLVAIRTTDGSHGPAMAETQRQFGFTPKWRLWRELASATFVSSAFVTDGRSWRFCPLPGRLLKRMWWTVTPPSTRQLETRRAGDALGLLTSHAGHPIVESLCREYTRDGVMPTYAPHAVSGAHDGTFDYRVALAYAYSVSTTVIDEAARRVSAAGFGVHCDPFLDELFARDLQDVSDRLPV